MGVVNHIIYGRGLWFYPFKEQIFTTPSWCQKFIEICQILKELWHYVPFGTLRD